MRFPQRIAHLYCPSTHSSVCPAVMTILFLHSRPTSTPVTIFHLYRASGTWKEKVNIFCTCLCIEPFGLMSKSFLSRWAESVKLGRRDETSILDGVWKSFPTLCLYTEPVLVFRWCSDTARPDTPGTELVTDEDMRIDSFWPTQIVFAFYRNCISVQWLISLQLIPAIQDG